MSEAVRGRRGRDYGNREPYGLVAVEFEPAAVEFEAAGTGILKHTRRARRFLLRRVRSEL